MKLKLPNVTLFGIDCVNVERLQAVMDVCENEIDFGATKLLTSLLTDDPRAVKISNIENIEDFSRFCIEDLHKYVDTEFVLLIQHDGFILNPQSWSPDFLRYDYVGAPWLVANWSVKNFDFPKDTVGTRIVGNGGFSIRSKKFLDTSARLAREGKIPKEHPEDVAMCVWYRDIFEKEGVKFAPVELAVRFSIEGEDDTYDKQFGFHGYGWTNIDKWVDEHPQYPSLVNAYRQERDQKQCTIYLVRHGETEWNVSGLIQGQRDSVLTLKGVTQAEVTAKNLKHVHFDAIYSSDLLRAKRTAEIIKLERRLVIQTSEALRERTFGHHEGTSYEDFAKTFKSYFKNIKSLPYDEQRRVRPDKDVESDEEITSRFTVQLREIAIANAGKTVLVVTHGGCIRTLLVHLGYASYKDLPVGAFSNAGYAKILCDGVDFVIKEVRGIKSAPKQ